MIPEILKLLQLCPDKYVKDILCITTVRCFKVLHIFAVEILIIFMLMELPQNVSKNNVLMASCSRSQTAKNITIWEAF